MINPTCGEADFLLEKLYELAGNFMEANNCREKVLKHNGIKNPYTHGVLNGSDEAEETKFDFFYSQEERPNKYFKIEIMERKDQSQSGLNPYLVLEEDSLVENDKEQIKQKNEHSTEVVSSIPESWKILYNEGFKLGNQHKYPEAIAKYKEAISLNPEYGPAYHAWGDCLLKLERYSQAIIKFALAIIYIPEHAAPYFNWGLALECQDNYPEAAKKYFEATQKDPSCSLAYYKLGVMQFIQQNYDDAIKNFETTIKYNSEYSEAYFYYGKALVHLKNYPEALKKLDKAIELDSKFNWAYYLKGCILIEQNQFDEAVQNYENALNYGLDLNNSYIHNNKSFLLYVYFKAELLKHQINEFTQLQADQNSELPSQDLLELEYMSNRLFEIINPICNNDFRNQIIKKNDIYQVFKRSLLEKSSYYHSLGKYDEEIQQYVKASNLNPSCPLTSLR